MRHWLYILNPDHSITRTRDLMKWARWFETADRHVAKTQLVDGSEVSTVFLGLDHGFGSVVILFETAYIAHPDTVTPSTYNGRQYEHIEIMQRYSTYAEAMLGHMEHAERLTEHATGWQNRLASGPTAR